MKVIGVACSPRVKGNTEILVQEVLNSAQAAGAGVELVTIAGRNISPCDGCESCRTNSQCAIKDDMQELYTKLQEADGIVFGSPVYFWNMTAQAKAVVDRTYAIYFPQKNIRKLQNKVGGIAIVGRRAGCGNALAAFNNFFALHGILMAGRALGYADKEGDIRQDRRALDEAQALGKNMVALIKALSSAK